jgi:tRNA modification GTPase
MLPRHQDAIIAVATAAGRGAVGIVRVSGPALQSWVQRLLGCVPAPRQATLLPIPDAQGVPIDSGLVIFFPGPHSYTGEDVLELQVHGGPVILRMVQARCLALGNESMGTTLRLAEPGEFTLRAFLNGKLDLAQAEAVSDLIDASTEQAARSATRALAGDFSLDVTTLSDQLIELRALLEATLDFPEEEIDVLRQHDVSNRLQRISQALQHTLHRAQQGRLLRDGLTVVLAGQPNVGKSSLLNRLAGTELAIVTPVAGTTRDRIEHTIAIDGVPVHIIDTAGLRSEAQTDDAIERIGMQRSWAAIAQADIIVLMHDLGRAHDAAHAAADVALLDNLRARLGHPSDLSARLLHVDNKCDEVAATQGLNRAQAGDETSDEASSGAHNKADDKATHATSRIRLSALTGEGLDTLRATLLQRAGWQPLQEGTYLARARHVQALKQAQQHTQAAQTMVHHAPVALELVAEELRLAHQALAAITGVYTADDLLGAIFGKFCIGK